MEKKNDWYKSWQQQYCILGRNSLWCLDANDKEPSYKHQKIDLVDVINVCQSGENTSAEQYKFDVVQLSKKWTLRVSSNQERSDWINAIQQQCDTVKSTDTSSTIYFQGMMEFKNKKHRKWNEKYFVLKKTKLHYCDIKNKDKVDRYKVIDLRNVEAINVINSSDLKMNDDECDSKEGTNTTKEKKNNLYYQFEINEGTQSWLFRLRSKKERDLWMNKIINEYDKYPLTLLRYEQILNQLKYKDGFGKFMLTSYKLSGYIDDYMHVMRYHNNIDFITKFQLSSCDENCPSWKRFNSPQTKWQYQYEKYENDNAEKYFAIHDEENALQDIFDKIHCYIYHSFKNGSKLKNKRNMKEHVKPINKNEGNEDEKHAEELKNDGDGTVPPKYNCGYMLHYHQGGPGHGCLKHELRPWIDEGTFHRIIIICHRLSETQDSKRISCCSNNDHFNLRFGCKICLQHILSIYFYCNYTDLCYAFRKTFRGNTMQTSLQVARNNHYQKFYWLGRFLYEGILLCQVLCLPFKKMFVMLTATEFYGKNYAMNGKTLYVGLTKRFLFHALAGYFVPISATSNFDVAADYAMSKDDGNGMIIQISPLLANVLRGEMKGIDCSWISQYGIYENEYLLYGHSNYIMIQNIFIWSNDCWKSLQFEMNALNYLCKISMGFAGIDCFNHIFDNDKYDKVETQKFLVELIEYELRLRDKDANNENMDDSMRYIHQLFHYTSVSRTGGRPHSVRISLSVNFWMIQQEADLSKELGKYLLENPDDDAESWKISKEKIVKLFPNIQKYCNENQETIVI